MSALACEQKLSATLVTGIGHGIEFTAHTACTHQLLIPAAKLRTHRLRHRLFRPLLPPPRVVGLEPTSHILGGKGGERDKKRWEQPVLRDGCGIVRFRTIGDGPSQPGRRPSPLLLKNQDNKERAARRRGKKKNRNQPSLGNQVERAGS